MIKEIYQQLLLAHQLGCITTIEYTQSLVVIEIKQNRERK